MGTRLNDHRPAGTRPLAATPPSLPGWLQAGRATTLPARKGLAYCRIDGLAGALPAPETPLFSGLLEAGDGARAAQVAIPLAPDP
jgi:hypothetical protein